MSHFVFSSIFPTSTLSITSNLQLITFRFYPLNSLPPLADYIYSVSEIEKMIGGEFDFFPLAPEGVKNSCNISDWPGLSSIAGKPSGKGE